MKGLNTIELRDALKANNITNRIFNNVLASDEFHALSYLEKPLFIVNSQPASMSGEHWMGIYVDTLHLVVEIFDSLGKHLQDYRLKLPQFISNYRVEYVLDSRVQQKESSLCGHYCLFYSLMKGDGYGKKYISKNIPSHDWISNCIPFLFNLIHIKSEGQCCKIL